MTARRRHPLLLPFLLLLLVLAACGSVTLGAVPISPERLLAVLMGGGDAIARAILIDLRLPRMILGLQVGGMLGLPGAALQGYRRNPLAGPSVMGGTPAEEPGAGVALYFGTAQKIGTRQL